MATFGSSFQAPKQSTASKVASKLGGPVGKFFDVLQAPQRAAFGTLTGIGPVQGIKQKTSFSDVLGKAGIKEGTFRTVAGLAGDIVLDPVNLLGFGLASKVAKGVGAGSDITKGISTIKEAKDFVVKLKIPKVKSVELLRSARAGAALTKTGEAISAIPAVRKTTNTLKEAFVFRHGLSADTSKQFAKNQTAVEGAKKIAVYLGRELDQVSKDVATGIKDMLAKSGKEVTDEIAEKLAKVRIAQVLRYGAISTIPGLDNTAKGVIAVADKAGEKTLYTLDKIRGKFKSLAEQLVTEGVLDPDVLAKKDYLPRLYDMFQGGDSLAKLGLSIDVGEELGKAGYKTGGVLKGLGRAARRLDDAELGRRALYREGKGLKDIAETPLEVLKARGEKLRLTELKESFDPVKATVLGLYQEGRLAANAKLLNNLSKNMDNIVEQLQGSGKIGELIKVSGKQWGPLDGKLIPKVIKDYLSETVQSEQSDIMKYLDSVTRHWAYGVTIPNPAYHIRNFLTNMYLAYLGGLNPGEYLLGTVMPRFNKASKYFDEATEAGVIGTTSKSREVEALASGLEDGKPIMQGIKEMDIRVIGRGNKNPIGWYLDKMEKLGPKVEDNARLALYADARAKGMTVAEAKAHVNKYLFDYKALTPFEKKFMRRLFPFYTFPRKVIPLVLETAVRDTGKISIVPKASGAVEELSDSSDAAKMEKYLPKWMREGFYVRTPFTQTNPDTGKKEYLYLDTRVLPFQDMFELATPRGLLSRTSPLIKAPIELGTNRNIFFDKEITSKYNPWQLQVADHVENLLRSSSSIGRILASSEKLLSASLGKEDYADRNKEMWVVLLDVLGGLKLQPFNIQKGVESNAQSTSSERSSIKREITTAPKKQSFVPDKVRQDLLRRKLLSQ